MGRKNKKQRNGNPQSEVEEVLEEKETLGKQGDVEQEISSTQKPQDLTEETKVKKEKQFKEEKIEYYDDIEEKDLLTDTEKKKRRKKKIIIISVIVFVFLFLFFGGLVCVNKLNDKVYKNVFVCGIDMSGKSKDEVYHILDFLSNVNEENPMEDKILEAKKEAFRNIKFDIYQENENIYSVSSEDISFLVDAQKTTEEVIRFGRSGNIFKDNFQIFKAFFTKKEIPTVYQYDEVKLDEICKNIELSLKERFVDDKYSIDEQNRKLVITRGTTGNTIHIENEKNKMKLHFENLANSCFKNLENMDTKYVLSLVKKNPTSIDIDAVYKELKKDPKDAYIDKTTNPIKLVAEELGYDINLEEVRKLINKEENKVEGKVIEIPIEVLEPKVKLADITYTLYQDKIAGYTTYFDPGQTARANNLAIALQYLNGKIVMPGEIFSYNVAIGDTTVAKGYQPAATFKGGRVVQELGGGICQTTSTLYNVALMANLEIVERHQHGLPVGYVPPSRDATVYSPSLDFKFKNTRKYPVKIVTSFSSSGSMNISIFGTREETEYEVNLSHKYLSTIPFTTKYEYDANMPEGQQVVVSVGVNGYTSEGYITKKHNGAVIYSGLLSRDKYNPQQQIIRVGTKK